VRASSSGAELDSSPDLVNTISDALSPEWKQEANHRLAAHRARRGRATLQAALPGMEERLGQDEPASQPKSKSVADRVAARYAKAPSYSEMLAAEARNAARAAEAAAVAAEEARDAAQAILVGLDADLSSERGFNEREAQDVRTSLLIQRQSQTRSNAQEYRLAQPRLRPAIIEPADESEDLDDEPVAPVQPLPAKLLEFPRELVAARKARPRLAEGPLREEYDHDAMRSQLRIFEVEPETISTDPVVEPVLPEWSPIRLDSPPDVTPFRSTRITARGREDALLSDDAAASANQSAAGDFDLPLQTAPLEDRLMATVVDAALVVAGFLVFVLVFAACTAHPPVGKPALIGATAALFAFAVIYQLLFFCFGHDTPGMRYAKIALCTFDDENPTRQIIRRRLGALLLSASPLGLGILWAFFDDDRLGWHDRISQTYQRSYR